jgi:hypothetical protein
VQHGQPHVGLWEGDDNYSDDSCDPPLPPLPKFNARPVLYHMSPNATFEIEAVKG